MAERPPVTDWATDWDHTRPEYAQRSPEVWEELRASCPVAHTERFGGAWLPVNHADVSAIAHDTEHFTSESVVVSDWKPDGSMRPRGFAPPITSDPPFHQESRRILLPAFSPKEIAKWEPATRKVCNELLDAIEALDGPIDAAQAYTQHIPVRVIAEMLGLPEEDGDKFRGFIYRILEQPGGHDIAYEDTLDHYLSQKIEERQASGEEHDDLIAFLLKAELDGEKLSPQHVFGTIALLLIAGIDTTWSSIGASLWHLAQHPEDRKRLVDDPDVLPFAVEEFLRVYAPVTMARVVAKDVEIGGVCMHAGDWTLLPFPAANRDPEAFERADEFVIDRERNRHVAFGLGIHRCLGSNLARMEVTVAIDEWMKRFPDFELSDPAAVRWSTGQVRGPRELPVRIAGRDGGKVKA
jgi:cytochrome P450